VLRAAFAPDQTSGESSLSFDADLALVRVHGDEVKLGARQAQLLRYFLDNVGRVIPIEELSKHLFLRDDVKHHATVRVHLHNLRKKIETHSGTAQHLVTVPEQGYVFVR
jgi:two-component system response regulator VicR